MSEVIWDNSYYGNGKLRFETPYVNDKIHGIERDYRRDGQFDYETIYLHGEEVTMDEWRRYELTIQLAGIDD